MTGTPPPLHALPTAPQVADRIAEYLITSRGNEGRGGRAAGRWRLAGPLVSFLFDVIFCCFILSLRRSWQLIAQQIAEERCKISK